MAQIHADTRLSAREQDVLVALVRGLTNAAIAAELYISERTVEAHLQHAFLKFGIHETPGVNKRVLAAVGFLEQLSLQDLRDYRARAVELRAQGAAR